MNATNRETPSANGGVTAGLEAEVHRLRRQVAMLQGQLGQEARMRRIEELTAEIGRRVLGPEPRRQPTLRRIK